MYACIPHRLAIVIPSQCLIWISFETSFCDILTLAGLVVVVWHRVHAPMVVAPTFSTTPSTTLFTVFPSPQNRGTIFEMCVHEHQVIHLNILSDHWAVLFHYSCAGCLGLFAPVRTARSPQLAARCLRLAACSTQHAAHSTNLLHRQHVRASPPVLLPENLFLKHSIGF